MQHTLHISSYLLTAPMHMFNGMAERRLVELIIIYCQKCLRAGNRDMQQMWVAVVTFTARWQSTTTQCWYQLLVWEGSYIMVYYGKAVYMMVSCEWLWLTCAVNAAQNTSSEASVKLAGCSLQKHLSKIQKRHYLANPYKLSSQRSPIRANSSTNLSTYL